MIETDIRVLAADDHPEVLARVCRIVSKMPGVEVVGSATNGQEAVTAAQRLDPDVILMDLRMPLLDGIQATARIVGLGLKAKVIALIQIDKHIEVLG